MNIHERIKNMPQIDPEETVYRLTVEDSLCIIADNVDEEDLDAMSDTELDLLIQAINRGFGHIEWYEWGEAALGNFTYDHPTLLEEDDDDDTDSQKAMD